MTSKTQKPRARGKTKAQAEPTQQPATTPTEPAAPTPGPRGKIGVVVAMLQRAEGATIPDLMKATGWQAHSVRGALAGAIKKKLGVKVTSEKRDAGRIYRIEAADDAS
jgi:hypothetical protein